MVKGATSYEGKGHEGTLKSVLYSCRQRGHNSCIRVIYSVKPHISIGTVS